MKTSMKKIIWMAMIAFAIGGVLMSRHLDSIRQEQSHPADNTYLYEAGDMIDNQHYVGW